MSTNKRYYSVATSLYLIIFLLPYASAQLTPNIWKKFIGEPVPAGTPDLIDFSYAGYKNGEEAIPEDFSLPIFDVTNYGAIPNDGKSDTQAIRDTLAAAEKGGVVFFPPGQYDTLTSSDTNFDRIRIPGSNIILRGSGAEGANNGGTTIKMHNDILNNRGWEVTLFSTRWINWGGSSSTLIKGSFPKGTMYFDVEDVSGLNNPEFININAEGLFGDDWDQHSAISEDDMPRQFLIKDNGIAVSEFHEVDRIEGNRIYVKAPVLTHLNSSFKVSSRNLHTGIGFEDLHIDGNMTEPYQHTIQDSRGAIQLWLTAHSWVRRCRFSNTTSAIMFENTYCNSAISNVVDGNATHYSIVVSVSTYCFVGFLEDYTNNGMQHGTNVGGRTVGTTYWRIGGKSMTGPDGHGGQPRITLFDNYRSVDHDRSSGTYRNLPHHLDGYVRWNNTTNSNETYDLWTWDEVGKRVTITQGSLIGYKSLGGSIPRDAYFEGFGTRVSPDSLYEAQLQRRLGILPTWVDAIKGEYRAFFQRIQPALDKTEIPITDEDGSLGGPKIEGPWLWVLVPDERLDETTDLLAKASDGNVTEKRVATTGTLHGNSVGDYLWTPMKISARGSNNITDMTRKLGWNGNNRVIYGFITLDSVREQKTKMFVGSDDSVKVWLNGELVQEKYIVRGASDYQESFPVTLKQGKNTLLVAVGNGGGRWSGFFGFQADAEYDLSPFTGIGYAFFNDEIYRGDTFTLELYAENVTDLANWQFDITFDPLYLEAIEVNKGYFLELAGGVTTFDEGTIDNQLGQIIGLSEAKSNGKSVNGTGLLLSVTFLAKAGGDIQLRLGNFQFTSDTGQAIPAGPLNVSIGLKGTLIWDVNEDRSINILDLVLVAQNIGETASADSRVDVNSDGSVNILDLVLVAQHLGQSAIAAPASVAIENAKGLDPATVQAWIEQARAEDDGSIVFQQGIATLERLLASLIPEKTVLLPNYPNPFNPETWIPYQLAIPADVSISIYTADGKLVRTLDLGHQPIGIYQHRNRAAYWDGKNELNEPVASGVYFYTLTTGDFTTTRKMLNLK